MYCPHCGNPNPDGANFCSKCRKPLTVQQAVQQPKKKKSPLKIILIVVLIFVVLMWLIGTLSGGDDSATDGGSIIAGQSEKAEGVIGDYVVLLKDAKVVESSLDGDTILVVTYSFTNNSENAAAFMYALTDKAFQNGVETGDVYTNFGIEDDYDFDAKSREIQPGVTLDVQVAYELNDATSDVTLEITEFISFNDDKLTYTVELGE